MAASMKRSVLLLTKCCCKKIPSTYGFSPFNLAKKQSVPECIQLLSIRTCASSTKTLNPAEDTTHHKVLRISKAMQAYLEKASAHEKMLAEHNEEFEMGRRYLANMMGADPENFAQEDIDEAISYLLPSGLFSKKARPKMKPPSEIFPPRKAAEFDASGRPYHCFFYTGLPNYYDILHALANKIDSFSTRKVPSDPQSSSDFLGGTEWLSREELEEKLVETVTEYKYEEFVLLMDKLANHPKAVLEKDFIMSFRQPIATGYGLVELPELLIDSSTERRHVTVAGARKASTATVTVWDKGTGLFDVNGRGLDDFPGLSQREQLMSPLVFVNKLGRVDVEATVEGKGDTAMAGAIRIALSQALAAFEDEDTQEQMRQAGLLTKDPRNRERKKPGQPGARAKKTWKRR